jgi:AraC-like DNA-binding protein
MVDSAAAEQRQRASSPSVANACVNILSTNDTSARERFDYWRDAICSAVFEISLETPPEHFNARIAARSAGPLRFARSQSTEYRIVRSRRDIARASADHYSIYLQISGQTNSILDHETITLNAGEIGLYDGRDSFHGMHSGHRAVAVVPHAMIDRRAPWLRKRASHKLAPNSMFVNLARRHLLQLSDTDASLSDSAISVLAENLCNLVALATATDVEPRQLEPDLQMEAVLALCRQSLHDPDLSPRVIADRLGISVRTLHFRFRQMGESFGRWVLNSRLEASSTALRDQDQKTLNISKIAYNCGFNDLSHFNRSFRGRFEMTPREWRNESRRVTSPD